jgi:hypothetical protein
VRAAGRADPWGVKNVAAVVLLIVAVNVVPRVVGVPAIDLTSIDLPDVPDWLRHLNLAKNVIIGALIALAVLGAVLKSRDH